MGSLSVLNRYSSTAMWVCLQILPSIGADTVIDTLLPAFQAGVAESDITAATASWTLIRSFGNVWGVAIPTAVFNIHTNRFATTIDDPAARDRLQHGDSYAWATKSFIEGFAEPAQSRIIDVFTMALNNVLTVSIAFAGLAFFVFC
ncbi:hypothetical protein MMYC01_208130 [Madurella mycetomatis]|uniref:Uncharacterized protein n=1 Tax=Madurella mycetomatis TaxID=100816 RepID=A0A175VV41_9PEZI|nr:hypothetical protein MMYC01_208130 [Madurella mycetomatis]